MNIQENVSLSGYSTMALGGMANYLVRVLSKDELVEAVNFAKAKGIPCLVIGTGSNIIWKDEGYPGLVLVSDIKGLNFDWQNDTECLVTIGSGEVWDEVVGKCVEKGLSGIEALSLIPGKSGATPVQNVGAYGQEIANTLVSLEAYDTIDQETVIIENKDCNFGYRTSRFKTNEHGRYFIINITLRLIKTNPSPPFYSALSKYLEDHQINNYTPQVIRDAVIDIRSHKLPDPKTIHNNGSFFANPIISNQKFLQLLQDYPDLPHWPSNEGNVKIPAAWLIEKAGFKDYHDGETGMATWPTQPLVLVNEHAKSTADLINFRDRITREVSNRFGIDLIQEPELLPTT